MRSPASRGPRGTGQEAYATSWAAGLVLLSCLPLLSEDGRPWTAVLAFLRIDPEGLELVEGSAGERFGFKPTSRRVTVRSIVEARDPDLSIIWQQEEAIPVYELPRDAIVFAFEKRTRAPLVAGLKTANGAVLWTATSIGKKGHERYPYLAQALADVGFEPPAAARNLWVFFDSSYRLRADPRYLARKWRSAGVSAVHIAAWHYFEADAGRDEYLTAMIGACHRNAIHVYAWLELPHVSERFWQDHPEWREKTALDTDAHLDWRKLMNLRNPECRRAVAAGVRDTVARFDWDGVNLAELYFESLEGAANPSRFTPMNPDIRAEFKTKHGFDPRELFEGKQDPAKLRTFLDYRAELAARLQQDWMTELDSLRVERPHLDMVLTHVDNLLDTDTRDRIGADAKRVLPLLESRPWTFLVEDPATAWASGPDRYRKLGGLYRQIAKRAQNLAIDINVVERYQDVYPTKQQTGVELLMELRAAADNFARVALYFEASIADADWPFLTTAMAPLNRRVRKDSNLEVDATAPLAVRWHGGAKVNGVSWPAVGNGWILLPAGESRIEPAPEPALALTDLNANLISASIIGDLTEFSYHCGTRAFAKLSKIPKRVSIDGEEVQPTLWLFDDDWVLVLPRGQHLVSIRAE